MEWKLLEYGQRGLSEDGLLELRRRLSGDVRA